MTKPKLSKTAAAAVRAVEVGEERAKQHEVEETSEQKIRNIRNLRIAKLFVPMHYVDFLLEEYDSLRKVKGESCPNPEVYGCGLSEEDAKKGEE